MGAQASIVHKQTVPWGLSFQLPLIEPRHRTPECATALTGALLMYGDGSLLTTFALAPAGCRHKHTIAAQSSAVMRAALLHTVRALSMR